MLMYISSYSSFNPSVEGKPLQPYLNSLTVILKLVSIPLSRGSLCNKVRSFTHKNVDFEFQSLCRGEASATTMINITKLFHQLFQSLCRGEASATQACNKFRDCSRNVSIPLSRGSLCNQQPIQIIGKRYYGFNPSVEGKPLQHILDEYGSDRVNVFQSLCRGEASATY